jgi:hypothetical protein
MAGVRKLELRIDVSLIPSRRGLPIDFTQLEHWGLGSATNSVLLPKLKPRAMCEHLIVPSIGCRDVACGQWPNVWRFEHFLKLLDVVNDAFNVHSPIV